MFGIRLGLGLSRIAGVTFDPLSLFANGKQGMLSSNIDPAPGGVFQDAAGTIPCTIFDQPVGRVNDISGNGNHATQSFSNDSRPTLMLGISGNWYLHFVGVDDYLQPAKLWCHLATDVVWSPFMSVSPSEVQSLHNWFEDRGDAPGDASTPYHFSNTNVGRVFSGGETYSGSISTVADEDWFRLAVVPGINCRFVMVDIGGNQLIDPVVTAVDSTGRTVHRRLVPVGPAGLMIRFTAFAKPGSHQVIFMSASKAPRGSSPEIKKSG